MTVYEKLKRAEDTTEYFVIMVNHHQLREWIDWPPEPTLQMVQKLVEPLVDGWLEHFPVHHHATLCSLFLDREAQLKNKQRNEVATEIWREDFQIRWKRQSKAYVLGDAVLFGKIVWKEEWSCR